LAAASSSILASIGISRDSPDRGLSHAEIAAAESVFQASPVATGKIYDHSKRMKEKRMVPKVGAVGRGLDSHTLTPRAFAEWSERLSFSPRTQLVKRLRERSQSFDLG
jgi:hypothetical protein